MKKCCIFIVQIIRHIVLDDTEIHDKGIRILAGTLRNKTVSFLVEIVNVWFLF